MIPRYLALVFAYCAICNMILVSVDYFMSQPFDADMPKRMLQLTIIGHTGVAGIFFILARLLGAGDKR